MSISSPLQCTFLDESWAGYLNYESCPHLNIPKRYENASLTGHSFARPSTRCNSLWNRYQIELNPSGSKAQNKRIPQLKGPCTCDLLVIMCVLCLFVTASLWSDRQHEQARVSSWTRFSKLRSAAILMKSLLNIANQFFQAMLGIMCMLESVSSYLTTELFQTGFYSIFQNITTTRHLLAKRDTFPYVLQSPHPIK